MQTITKLEDLRKFVAKSSAPLGLVPTMGALHAGHLALLKRARSECATVIVSVFVNPTQFGPNEDFATYPRTFQNDSLLLEENGADCLFAPTAQEIYPSEATVRVTVGEICDRLEGRSRPNHFTGVATVVAKLLCATGSEYAYFGAKDAQQAVIVRKVASELLMRTKIVVVSTVREADGLALSSRNRQLNSGERKAASVLFRALSAARTAWQDGVRNPGKIRQTILDVIGKEPLARLDYAVIANPDTFEELESASDSALALVALWIGATRLIDNDLLGD